MNRQNKWLLCSLVAGTAAAVMAFTGDPGTTNHLPNGTDTIPSRKAGDRDLDKEIRELEKARIQLKDVDLKKIQADINLSLKEIDLDQLKLDITTKLKDVNLDKIQLDLEKSIANIDIDKIQKDIEKALENAEVKIDPKEMEEVKKELNKAKVEIRNNFNETEFRKELEELKKTNLEELKKINLKDIEKDIEDARKEIEKAKISIDLDKDDIKIDLENAAKDIEAARVELKGYQEMIYAMEEDGLLNTKEDYSIRYIAGELSINGKKQPDSIASKYKKYFKKNIRLEKKDGKMEINHTDKSGKKEWSI